MKALLLSLALIFSFAELHSQNAAAPLQNAMRRSGDWNIVKTITYKTTGMNYNKWQNYSFQKPVATMDEALRAFDFTARVYYTKTISRYGGGYVFEFVNIGKDTTRYLYDLLKSRNGYQLQKGGKRVFDAGFLFINETFPFYALRTVLHSGDSLRVQNDSTVRRLFRDTTHEDIVFNKEGLLSRISRVQKGLTTEKQFRNYREYEKLIYPETVNLYTNGELTRTDRVESILINEPFDQSLLEVPAAYKPEPSAIPMKVVEIAKDVFLIENVTGGRNVMFIKMSDGIFVTEAPVSNEVTKSIIELIYKTVPGKKIKYVHLSHFHNDHTSGINALLAEGATLIATSATIAAVKTIIHTRRDSPDAYLSFTKEHVLKNGEHELQFYEVANTHAEGLSFLFLPRQQIIYQGDLFSLPDDKTITPAIDITRDFYHFIQTRKLPVKRIIGHHGASAISSDDLEKAVLLKPVKN